MSWQTGATRDEFVFEGGLILVANAPLDDGPALRAVKTRVPVLHHRTTNQGVAALMRRIARHGHRHGPYELAPEKCPEVAHALIERTDRLKRSLDLRLFVNTFQDRLQYENGAAETPWLDLPESRLKERVLAPAGGLGVRAATRDKELDVLRQTAGLPPWERLEFWKKETGRSKAAHCRRIAELNKGDSHLLSTRTGT